MDFQLPRPATDDDINHRVPDEDIGNTADDTWAGEDLPGHSDDDLPAAADKDDEVGGRGDALVTLFDTSSEEERREFFGSNVFQDWLKAMLKKNGVAPVAETAPPPSRVQPFVSPAALRLAAKAVAIWQETYP